LDYRTDNGNPVIDAPLAADTDLESLRAALDAIPGVVGHGLFLTEADEVIIEEGERGRVTTIRR
jgi:ribose 5-phosphate isomerase A